VNSILGAETQGSRVDESELGLLAAQTPLAANAEHKMPGARAVRSGQAATPIVRAPALLLICLLTASLSAQEPPGHWPKGPAIEQGAGPGAAVAAPSLGQKDQLTDVLPPQGRWHEPVEIAFSVTVLVFGLALIIVFTSLVRREGKGWRTIYMRLVVLTIVVTAGLFVIVAGYTQDQIAPMMGLLGTLVGYLLGKEGSPAVKPEHPGTSSPTE